MQRQALYALNTLALVWAGMLFGVSFLATPAKFLAPSLTLPVALDVGRHTFGLFSIVEVVGAVALLAAAVLIRRGWLILLLASLVGSLVALEFIWLLPALDARVEIILHGGTPEESGLHNLYIAFDAAKLLLLGAIAWRSHSASVAPQGGIAADVR
jgi:hypothetical protein